MKTDIKKSKWACGVFFALAVVAGLCAGGFSARAAETNPGSTGNVVYDAWALTGGLPNEKLQFSGLDPRAAYTLELEFLAWNRENKFPITIGRLAAGSETMAEGVTVGITQNKDPMPPAQRWMIPQGAVKDGKLTVQLEKLEVEVFDKKTKQQKKQVPQPFGIHVKMLADNAGIKAVTMMSPPKIEVPVVRLTPRPTAVAGLDALKVDLGGEWSVNLNPQPDFWKLTQVPAPAKGSDWLPVKVPGELGLQVPELPDHTVAYCRQFSVPETWRGKRIKLKCDSIFNEAKVWINGVEIGTHLGNFTPFELDITKAVKPGQTNVIAVSVSRNTEVDKLAAASGWVGHRLMGILRKIYVFAVPEVNVADVHVLTSFDKDYRDVTLTAKVQVVNESAQVQSGRKLRVELRDRAQKEESAAPVVPDIPEVTQQQGQEEAGPGDSAAPVIVNLPEIAPGGVCVQEIKMKVSAPKKWDAEHPNLYDLSVALVEKGRDAAVVKERIGFRQIEIRGNKVFINNQRARYHGLVWSDYDPKRGCVLSGEDWRRDMRLLRTMNCNYIRYAFFRAPMAEELVEACDELGIFISEELPVTWTSRLGRLPLTAVLQSAVEIMIRDRSRASIVQWSLGNELEPDQNLLLAHRLAMQQLDSIRPFLTDGSWKALDLLTPHYSSAKAVMERADRPLPVMDGEMAHPAAYNRSEIYTDPGMRDIWGHGVADKWNKIVESPSYLGGAIWFGIDNWLLLPDDNFCGWGEWGVVDMWHRLKPEGWNLKKIFSPIYITSERLPAPAAGQPLRIPVENRHSFSDLKECRFDWAISDKKGTVSTLAMPGAKGFLEIPLPSGVTAGTLELKAYNPEGLMLDGWRIAVGDAPITTTLPAKKVEMVKSGDLYTIRCGDIAWELDGKSGKLVSAGVKGKKIAISGPELLILQLDNITRLRVVAEKLQPGKTDAFEGLRDDALNEWVKNPKSNTASLTQWTAKSVQAQERDGVVEVSIEGSYKEAEGRFVLRFTQDGGVESRGAEKLGP